MINLSKFDAHYNTDCREWISTSEFVNQFPEGAIKQINGEIYACKEIAIKYAQFIDPKYDLICTQILSEFFKGAEPIEGSIFSFRFHCNY